MFIAMLTANQREHTIILVM